MSPVLSGSGCTGAEQEGKSFVSGTFGGSGNKHRHFRAPETKCSPATALLLTRNPAPLATPPDGTEAVWNGVSGKAGDGLRMGTWFAERQSSRTKQGSGLGPCEGSCKCVPIHT